MKIVKHILLVLAATGLILVSQLGHARHAALLIDADSGDVLYELEANQSWYPASLTKLMTLYMAFSALESGRLRLNEQLNVSSHAARQPTSKLGLRAWDTISAEDAILSVITRSANDSAVVLAERLGGTESHFAIQMTSTAHSLGMYGSHFMNATGLPHDWQTTTARDMAILALKIQRNFPRYYPYFGMDSFYFNGRTYNSTNKFVLNYPGAEGMKTGYTCGSGFNLVASANQYGKRLIGVVLGGHSSAERYQHMFTMMDIGFSSENGMYRAKNIKSMSNRPVGSPPYQLSCGHRPSSHYAAHHLETDDDDRHIRYIGKASRARHHLAPKAKVATKTRSSGKTKTIASSSKSRHVAKSSKKASKTKVAATTKSSTRKSSKKVAATTTKGKRASKSTQTAKAATNKKANSSAASKGKKPASSAKSKGKGYYTPDSPSKTLAKSNGKSKRTAKKKS
jgi:D-alanyl-D-alanine carboxypeptidase